MGNELTGRDFFLAARSLIGVPWLYRGRSRQGVDCGGMLILMGKELGIIAPDYDRVYDPQSSYLGLHETLAEFAFGLPENEPHKEGDIWTYSFAGDMHAHCAVFSPSENLVIHAYPVVQAVAEHTATGKWVKRVHRRYRVRGLADG
jgi:cell wall-associated NlpC family hydrolase